MIAKLRFGMPNLIPSITFAVHIICGSIPGKSSATFQSTEHIPCASSFSRQLKMMPLYAGDLRMCVCAGLVARSCLILCDLMDYSPPVSSVHEDSPPKNIGVGCKPSSRGSSQPRDRTQVSHTTGVFFTI